MASTSAQREATIELRNRFRDAKQEDRIPAAETFDEKNVRGERQGDACVFWYETPWIPKKILGEVSLIPTAAQYESGV